MDRSNPKEEATHPQTTTATEDNMRQENHQRIRAAPKETYPAPKVGTGPKTNGLKPAIKLKWMFIGRLDDSTTENDIIEYMKDKGIMTVKACHEIRTRGRSKAFKIGMPEEEVDKIDTEDFWPEGITFRPYLFS
ncbi:hypothetical protein ANN_28287 [Periplaneta americana]|uniref:Uncharacterized protein n=1 Tax=Periplaneta americana TaxID=6978 RepID=A0ABQ8TNN0_PERAM|nr:hypothetical protein ANN_28287 [Periplaneta americana]